MPYTSPLLYTITDTAADIVNVGVLQQQIESWVPSPPVQPLDYIDANSLPINVGQIAVHFVDKSPDAISDSDKAIVDAAVAAHTGKLLLTFKVTSKALDNPDLEIVEDATWQVIGGVVTNPAFFIPNVNNILGRAQGITKAVGTTAELRIIERDPSDDSEVVIAQGLIAETATMQPFALDNSVAPRVGTMEYRFEGRLNGATSAHIGFVSLALFEVDFTGLRPAT